MSAERPTCDAIYEPIPCEHHECKRAADHENPVYIMARPMEHECQCGETWLLPEPPDTEQGA